MRILITGSNGMLGSDLVACLASQYHVAGLGLSDNHHPSVPYFKTDVANSSAVFKAVDSFKPAIIVHSAAYTDVDGCELNPDLAYTVNTKGTQHVAQASDQTGATLFFISTDYVFDGTKNSAYIESDQPNPLSIYGRSKLDAEEWLKGHCKSVWIIRSSWLFGKNGKNFFSAVLKLSFEKPELKVVQDQKGAPTYTKDLARGLAQLIEKGKRVKGYEICHLANSGFTTWYEAAKKLIGLTGQRKEIKPISSAELNRPAKRPANSVLNMDKIKSAYHIELPLWEEALNRFWNDSLQQEWRETKSTTPSVKS